MKNTPKHLTRETEKNFFTDEIMTYKFQDSLRGLALNADKIKIISIIFLRFGQWWRNVAPAPPIVYGDRTMIGVIQAGKITLRIHDKCLLIIVVKKNVEIFKS